MRAPRTFATLVATAVAVAVAPTIGAQNAPSTTLNPTATTTDTTSTTVPSTNPTTTDTPSSTTAPVGTDPATSTTLPLSTDIPAPIDPLIPLPPGGFAAIDDGGDATPATPAGPWDGVGITNPQLAGLRAQVDLSQNKVVAAQLAVADAEAALVAAQAIREATAGARQGAADRYAAVRTRFTRRVAAGYIAAGDPGLRLRPQRDLSQEADRVVLPAAVTNSDRALADDYRTQRDRLSVELRTSVENEAAAGITLETAKAAAAAARAAATQAELLLAQTPTAIDGFVFPVAGPTSFVSTFGACRDGCSRRHQGNDLFARRNTPLVAVENGWVEQVELNNLGGLTVTLRGRSGYRYYYAHMESWAPLTPGQEILAGTVVGTVGNSGNAISTPPHVHFEIRPGNSPAIDPYPILVRAPRVTLTPEQVAQATGMTVEAAAALQGLPAPPGG